MSSGDTSSSKEKVKKRARMSISARKLTFLEKVRSSKARIVDEEEEVDRRRMRKSEDCSRGCSGTCYIAVVAGRTGI